MPFSEHGILGYQRKRLTWGGEGVLAYCWDTCSYISYGYMLKPECYSSILEWTSKLEEFLFLIENSRVKKDI